MTAFTLGRRIVAATGSVFSRSHHKESTRRRLVPTGIAAFLAATAGNFGIIFGLSLIPVIGASALALDYSKLMRDRGAVQNSLDAAAFATAKYYAAGASDEELLQYASDFFEANLPGFVDESDVTLQPRIEEEEITSEAGNAYTDRSVTLTATINHETLLARVVGVSTVSVESVSSVLMAGGSVEIALVMDNSDSMYTDGRLDLAKQTAKELVYNIAGSASLETAKFALVPFAATVNIGAENRDLGWLDTKGFAPVHHENLDWDTYIHPANIQDWDKADRGTHYTYREKINGNWQWKTRFDIFEMLDVEWAGCVEMRPWPHNTLDTYQSVDSDFDSVKYGFGGGDGLDALFVPYFAPAEPTKHYYRGRTQRLVGQSDQEDYYNDYLFDWVRPVALDPSQLEWVHTETEFEPPYDNGVIGDRQILRQKWVWRYQAAAMDNEFVLKNLNFFGPNSYCIDQPVMPLTDEAAEIAAAIDEMTYSGHTNIQQGLAWGWRLLSPREPFTEGRESDSRNHKIIIMLTDGENYYQNSSDDNETRYGAWGYGKDGRVEEGLSASDRPELYRGSYPNSFSEKMDVHTLQTCENARADGMTVFTIALDVANGSPVKELLEVCGGSGVRDGEVLFENNTFYYDVSRAELAEAMADIALQIAEMRLRR